MRNNLATLLKKGLLTMQEHKDHFETDLKIANIQLDSANGRMAKLRKYATDLTKLYNPARITAARLKSKYDDLSLDVSSGLLIQSVSQIEKNAKVLLEEAQRAQDELEAGIGINLEALEERDSLSLKISEALKK